MEKSQSKPNKAQDLKKITTRHLKLGVKFGKDSDGGIEAGLACGYEKKIDRTYDGKSKDIKER